MLLLLKICLILSCD